MTISRRLHSVCLITAVAWALPVLAIAQDQYPSKPVRIVVPYPAGGFNDTLARLIGKQFHASFGQPFVVENRPGGGTVIGTDAGLKAPADGYTLTVASFPTVVNQYLYQNLPYRAGDIAPVIIAGAAPNALVVRADSPHQSMDDLISYAKAHPGKINYASAGNGTSLHLAMEYFKNVTGTDMVNVPYRGSAPMITDLLGGQVDVMFDNLPNALPYIQSGKMRALAVSSSQRVQSLPDVPTIAEQGFAGFEVSPWYGLMAPAGTPRPILEQLNSAANKALQTQEVKDVFASQNVVIIGGSLGDFETHLQEQANRWAPVIHNAGIKLD